MGLLTRTEKSQSDYKSSLGKVQILRKQSSFQLSILHAMLDKSEENQESAQSLFQTPYRYAISKGKLVASCVEVAFHAARTLRAPWAPRRTWVERFWWVMAPPRQTLSGLVRWNVTLPQLQRPQVRPSGPQTSAPSVGHVEEGPPEGAGAEALGAGPPTPWFGDGERVG